MLPFPPPLWRSQLGQTSRSEHHASGRNSLHVTASHNCEILWALCVVMVGETATGWDNGPTIALRNLARRQLNDVLRLEGTGKHHAGLSGRHMSGDKTRGALLVGGGSVALGPATNPTRAHFHAPAECCNFEPCNRSPNQKSP